jgi:PAS domain S-box-containing protein
MPSACVVKKVSMERHDSMFATVLGSASQAWTRLLASGAITLLSILIVGVLWRRLGIIPDPSLILLFTVAGATYLAGGMAGMLSSAIVLFCSLVLFSHPLYPFRYSDMDWRQMMVIVIACPVIALMVGSLKEQVDLLKTVTKDADGLREEVKRLELSREALYVCDQRFRMFTDTLQLSAVFTLDVNGHVMNWNAGAERILGYPDAEVVGHSYSRFFVKEDLLGRNPDRLLEQARVVGRAGEEGWRLRKGGSRLRAKTTVVMLKSSRGAPAGFLVVMRDLSQVDQLQKVQAELDALKTPRSPSA